MDGAEDPVGLAADVLDDVDLAAGRPGAVDRGVGGEHPERRPEALADRHPGAHLHAPEGPVALAQGAHPGRGVVEAAHRLLPRGDGQEAARDRRVLGLVVLQLVVAPPGRQADLGAVAELEGPLGQVHFGAVELVRPDQDAARQVGALRHGRAGEADQRCQHRKSLENAGNATDPAGRHLRISSGPCRLLHAPLDPGIRRFLRS